MRLKKERLHKQKPVVVWAITHWQKQEEVDKGVVLA